MSSYKWLLQQQQLYVDSVPNQSPNYAIHPVSGVWQDSNYLKSVYWWGGGTTQQTDSQISDPPVSAQLGVVTFSPVQAFLVGGQRLRDWAVGSWLCHYLACAIIYRWQESGGQVLLPLQVSSPLLQWMKQETIDQPETFWQAELPNVFTGIFPDQEGWLGHLKNEVSQEWSRLILALEEVIKAPNSPYRLLNGLGWRVIHRDHAHLWTVYTASCPLNIETASADVARLHEQMSAQKLGRAWEGVWWGGNTSPTAGSHSIWHPGLKSIAAGGTWGLHAETVEQWWEQVSQNSSLAGLFSSGDRLNSIELVKRLASVPELIGAALEKLWGHPVPVPCPWDRFPDRSAIAASWVPKMVTPDQWNNEDLSALASEVFPSKEFMEWGMPHLQGDSTRYLHPRVLERRNVKPEGHRLTSEEQEALEIWDELMPKGWESTIEWTVGWRGDGDHMGDWFSGKQFSQKGLPWANWHPNSQQIIDNQLGITPPNIPADQPRKLDIPHSLDLSVLFSYWNQLLYPLVEKHHEGRVVFAGGDDFLLLGPITQAVSLTSALDNLWRGETTAITTALDPLARGWTDYQGEVYPVPGPDMSFSLGVVIAQRRIPQSRWHRGLNASYKAAKNQGRNRVCLQVLFNSGQCLEWICPWPLWRLLMNIQPAMDGKTELNRWEKLLSYIDGSRLVETSRLKQSQGGRGRIDLQTAPLLETLWQSVGLPLTWSEIQAIAWEYRSEIYDWGWWQDWVALRSFLARQAREREKWLELVKGGQP